jgi:acyl carrier protein
MKEQIRSFVLELAETKGITSVGDDDSLVAAGIIDSLGVFQLVAFLQEAFQIPIDDDEITPEHFRSVTTITTFVEARAADRPRTGTSASG